MAEHTGWVLGEPGGAPTSSPTNVGSQDEAGPSAQQTTHGACSSVQSEPSAPPVSLSPKVANPNARTRASVHHAPQPRRRSERGGGFSRASAGTYRPVYVLPDEEVEHRQRDVGQQLPQLPGQQHPQHAVLGRQVDPAPAHGHVRGVVADLLQGDRCHSDGQRNPPAEGRGISAAEVRPRPASKGKVTEALPLGEPHCSQRPGEQGAGDSNPHPSLLCRSPAKPTPMPHSQPPSRPGCTCRWLGVAGAGSSRSWVPAAGSGRGLRLWASLLSGGIKPRAKPFRGQ